MLCGPGERGTHLRTGLGCRQPCGAATQVGEGLGGNGGAVHDMIQRSDHQPAAGRVLCQQLCHGMDRRVSDARV